jgi:hypothetical protein
MGNNQTRKDNKRRKGVAFWFGGEIIESGFIEKHAKMIVLITVLFFVFIGNRYTCLQKLREIERLQRELKEARFEALSVSSELTGNSKHSQVEALVMEQGIDLEAATAPPYELYK